MQARRRARTNPERSEATRRALLEAARRLFVRRGYAATSTPEIVEAAGITRGALYHHFEDKQALFRALVETEAAEVARHIVETARASDGPAAALLAGAEAYLDAMTAPGRTRLLLVDGPAVLGPAAIRDLDERTAARTLRDGLRAASARAPGSFALERLAPLLSAAFDRAALEIEAGAEPRAVKAAMRYLLAGVIGGA